MSRQEFLIETTFDRFTMATPWDLYGQDKGQCKTSKIIISSLVVRQESAHARTYGGDFKITMGSRKKNN